MTKDEIIELKREQKLKNKLVAGIDCSTKICGYSILKNDKIIEFGHHEFDTDKHIAFRTFEFEEHIFSKIKHCDIFVLEDRLKSFSNSMTSNNTIMSLAHVNGNIETMLMKHSGFDNVFLLHPSTARSLALGKPWVKGRDTKEWIIESVMDIYNLRRGEEFPINPRSRTKPKKFLNWVEDVADSIILARALSRD